VAAGIDEILFVINRYKGALADYFGPHAELESFLEEKGKRALLSSVEQLSGKFRLHTLVQEKPLGLGHAVLCAEDFAAGDPFAVFLPDDIVFCDDLPRNVTQQMAAVFSETGGSVLALQAVPWERVASYGVIGGDRVRERLHRLKSVVEKPSTAQAPSNLTIVGRYVFTPAIFDCLRQVKPGWGGEIQLTDGIASLIQHEPVYGWEFEGRRYDTGEPIGFLRAFIEYALRSNESAEVEACLREIVGDLEEKN